MEVQNKDKLIKLTIFFNLNKILDSNYAKNVTEKNSF